LLGTADSEASRVLSNFGVDRASAQRAVTTALAGFANARQTEAASEGSKLDDGSWPFADRQ
jgi:hypothetical protein